MGDDAMIALMTRMDIMRDDITDLKLDVARANDAHEDHAERLGNLEDMTKTVVTGIEEIKNGPVYSLDRVITKRVAQVSGGMGLLVFVGLSSLGIF
jgi:DNA-directed RNA polymerase subunit K/omega|tara:strand:- start:39 stop:326 length:288 start_codon:yes stop_codon:yes gene_type:complete